MWSSHAALMMGPWLMPCMRLTTPPGPVATEKSMLTAVGGGVGLAGMRGVTFGCCRRVEEA
jgi:hypothetical protein